jgi:DNA-binding response OmpR family regulator
MALRVLVVDDDAELREVVAAYLKGRGLEVETAGDAETAMLRVVQDSFDAVLLDIQLPGLSGFKAVPAITEDKHAAVFLMSGHSDSELEKDALLVGAKALFRKPLDLDAVLTALQALPLDGTS